MTSMCVRAPVRVCGVIKCMWSVSGWKRERKGHHIKQNAFVLSAKINIETVTKKYKSINVDKLLYSERKTEILIFFSKNKKAIKFKTLQIVTRTTKIIMQLKTIKSLGIEPKLLYLYAIIFLNC